MTEEAKLYKVDKTLYPTSRYRKLKRYVDADGNEIPETYEQIKFAEDSEDVYHRVEPGEENRLDLIASKEEYLNNEHLWWVIAEASGIEDPLNVPIGTVLRIPSLSSLYAFRGVLS